MEAEANEFASEFLMPERDCGNDLDGITFNRLNMIKSFWGVSKAFIIRRAKTLDKISESTYKYFMIELGRKGERKNESGYVEIDLPNILLESLKLIKSELNLDSDDLAKVIKLNVSDYNDYFEQDRKVVRLKHQGFKQVI